MTAVTVADDILYYLVLQVDQAVLSIVSFFGKWSQIIFNANKAKLVVKGPQEQEWKSIKGLHVFIPIDLRHHFKEMLIFPVEK